MVTLPLPVSEDDLETFCHRWGITDVYVYGSMLHKGETQTSDIDLLVTFDPAHTPTLFKMENLREELETLLKAPVDITTKKAIEASPNTYIRQSILDSSKQVYCRR